MRAVAVFIEMTIRAGILLLKILLGCLAVMLVVATFQNPSLVAIGGLIGVAMLTWQWVKYQDKKK